MVERVAQLADERGDFVTGEDGFVVWWPRVVNGSLNAAELRILADELDRRNAEWASVVAQELEALAHEKSPVDRDGAGDMT
jgi:hypothetical protein